MELKKEIRNYIAEHPNCKFYDIVASGRTGSATCGEIWDALKDLSNSSGYDRILIEGTKDQETFRLAPGRNCYVEAVQDITIQCYKKLYDQMEDPDHAHVLDEIRVWAKAFEDWWWNLPESTREECGYWEAIDAFCGRLLGEGKSRDSNLQEFTAILIQSGYFSDELTGKQDLSREEAFSVIREWADEFWDSYKDVDAMEDVIGGRSYYDRVDMFIKEKTK